MYATEEIKMQVTEEMKQEYLEMLYEEMMHRGITKDEIPRIIGKTGFMEAFEEYPDIQLHYHPTDAVNEILLTAARF